MPKEKECFREQLARLDERFPEREMITISEAANFLGRSVRRMQDDKTMPTLVVGRKRMVPKVRFARWLS